MRGKCALLAVLVAAIAVSHASAALLAVDLGSDFIKVCLVKPGRTPISVVVNEMSKRKSPALVGFIAGARVLGEEAATFAIRYPETIFQRARDLLGKDANDPTIARMLKEHALPYEIVEGHNGAAAVKVDANTTISAEELVVGRALFFGARGTDHLAACAAWALLHAHAWLWLAACNPGAVLRHVPGLARRWQGARGAAVAAGSP